eukprot:7145445-Prymnesium_polylepis.1
MNSARSALNWLLVNHHTLYRIADPSAYPVETLTADDSVCLASWPLLPTSSLPHRHRRYPPPSLPTPSLPTTVAKAVPTPVPRRYPVPTPEPDATE